MPIDTSTIEGFEGMTPEQKIDALLKYDFPAPDLSNYIEKSKFDNVSSELASVKKELKGKMTAEETAQAEALQKQKEMEEKYNALLKDSTISKHKARFLALGYEEKLAEETATALFDGDMEKVFANQKKAQEDAEKRLRADLVKQDPKPNGSGGTGEEKPFLMKMAEDIGKERAAAAKNANDVLKHYLS